jgi:uncharacterized membrane protein
MSYPLHPFSTHFPIALLLTASALELWGLRAGREPEAWVRQLLRLGWWAALIALASGTVDLARQLAKVQEALGWINAHVGLSLATLAIYGRLAFRRSLAPRQRARLHLLGGALLLLGGLVGGHLVYALGFGRA